MQSQHTTSKTWETQNVESIEIYAPWATQISISGNPKGSLISVEYKSDGEYQNNVTLSGSFTKKKLIIAERWIPNFKQFNDKLSAHKAIATKLNIEIPQHISSTFVADDANIIFRGTLDNIDVTLKNGVFEFYGAVQSGNIQTVSAAVMVLNKELLVDAKSRTGDVKVISNTKSHSILKIQSISGNIHQK